MNVLIFTLVVFAGSLFAGFLGSLTGLGGGVVIVPLLTVALGVDIRYAIGASLVSVIATSSGAAAAYLKEGFTNMRVGIFLEVATTSGAILGASVATRLPGPAIEVVFGVVLLVSVYLTLSLRKLPAVGGEGLARRLRLNGSYPTPNGDVSYTPRRVPLGFGIMAGAGALSGLLGIGSGAVKVLALDQAMRLPFKVSTTTSNFMIGVTAAASAGIYLRRGFITPGLAMPVMLGVLAGSLIGARLLISARAPPASRLRRRDLRAGRRDDRRGAAPMIRRSDQGRWSDRAVEATMGTVLRYGVVLAAVLVAAGGVAYLFERWDHATHYSVFAGSPESLTTPAAILRGALALDPASLIALGLVVLVLTPVARVVFALLAFVEQRDRLYVIFSLIVLSVLFIGLTGHSL